MGMQIYVHRMFFIFLLDCRYQVSSNRLRWHWVDWQIIVMIWQKRLSAMKFFLNLCIPSRNKIVSIKKQLHLSFAPSRNIHRSLPRLSLIQVVCNPISINVSLSVYYRTSATTTYSLSHLSIGRSIYLLIYRTRSPMSDVYHAFTS
jgi:hypothetical protein